MSESFVAPAVEGEIVRRGAQARQFIAQRGDVLIWHGRLLHRGSKPNKPGMLRKSLICHYSGVTHRRDMPTLARDANGQLYALIKQPSMLRRALRTLQQRIAATL